MRTAIPPIREHVDAFKHGLQREPDGHKKPRLQMPYLLASGQARNRQEVASLLGVHRNTIGRWLALYAAKGLDALLDNSSAHTARRLTVPANVRFVFLPPYCPELNPIERVWRDLKDALAWLQFPNLDVQQDYMAKLLQAYEAATRQSLTGYPYLVEAVHALCS